jgi:hypothetical protein
MFRNERDRGMHLGLNRRITSVGIIVLIAATILAMLLAHLLITPPPRAHAAPLGKPFCAARPQLCTETITPWNYAGQYTGHDEPSLLFYSSKAGSGNSNLYQLTLPKDPPTLPAQDGSGGTWNFQLHPAFWFGMALCDDQSAPNVGGSSVGAQKLCIPDSDTNIFTGTDPSKPNYLGLTPGTAFMEMQFYPPGWGNVGTGVSCGPDNIHWCAALNIDSDSENENTGVLNNSACLNAAGQEYVNYAIITKSGQSQAPADPLRQTLATFETGPDTLEMNSGDPLTVDMHDTSAGFQVVIHDLTTGDTGSMTASIANGFGHPVYQPSASTCTDQPYAFHPMFSTSSPATRVLWAAHSYNVAYSDEIGHFEYCNKINQGKQKCSTAGVTDPGPSGNDGDEAPCFNLPVVPSTQQLSGCTGEDADFDGPEYANNWPGTNPASDATLHASPVLFSSPLFNGTRNYSQVAFETNLPRIEGADVSTNNACQRHVYNPSDPSPGTGCVNPPNGASFYPIYTTGTSNGACIWQEGGAQIPGTTNTFGGTSTAEYGGLQEQIYPAAGGTTQGIYETFHQTLGNNPCPAG